MSDSEYPAFAKTLSPEQLKCADGLYRKAHSLAREFVELENDVGNPSFNGLSAYLGTVCEMLLANNMTPSQVRFLVAESLDILQPPRELAQRVRLPRGADSPAYYNNWHALICTRCSEMIPVFPTDDVTIPEPAHHLQMVAEFTLEHGEHGMEKTHTGEIELPPAGQPKWRSHSKKKAN